MKKYLQFHRLAALLVVVVPLAIAGCGGGSATKTDAELAAEKLAADRMACTDAGGRFESDGSCTSAAELVAEAAEMACTDAGGRYESDGTCTSAADVEAERVAAEEAEAERMRQAETAAALSEAQMALSTAKAAVDMSADDAAQIEQQNAVVTAAQAVIDAARAASDVEALDAATADMTAARMAIADANARIAAAEAAAVRQALVDAAMCTAATTECVAAHDALIAALQADVDALADDDDATNAQQAAAQEALEAAQMARRDVAMRVAEIDRSTATGRAVGAAVDAANALEDARSADDIASAEALLATAKGMLTDADDYASQIESAEMAIARAKERNAVDAAVMAAEGAATGLADDSSVDAVTAAQGAVDAANMAIEGAEHLTDAEKATQTAKVTAAQNSVTVAKNANDAEAARLAEEKRKADEAAAAAKAKADKAMANKLYKGLGPDSTALDAATVEIGSAGLDADADGAGTDFDDVTLKATTTAVPSYGAWNATDYVRTTSSMTDHAVIYNNRDAPKMELFASKYEDVLAEGRLPATVVTVATNAGLIASNMFASGSGFVNHTEEVNDVAKIRGTYNGGMGYYHCTQAAADTPCRSAVDGSGGITLTRGTTAEGWSFEPDDGTMARTPDADYVLFGWWSRETDNDVDVRAFAQANGDNPAGAANLALIGTATYTGGAAGKYSINEPVEGNPNSGAFTATATLTAKFGNATLGGTISGMLTDFMAGGEAKDWSVSLVGFGTNAEAPIRAGGFGTVDSPAADGTDTARTIWTIDGDAAARSGSWSGDFYYESTDQANAANTPPTAAGMFSANHGNVGRMVGAFGAEK